MTDQQRILLVDDDPKLVWGLGLCLTRADFVVVTCGDGLEAIELLASTGFDILVTDIQMPRLDGLDLLAYVSVHHPNLACFVMSAHGTPQMKAKLPRDLVRFFQKPFV